MLMKIREMLQTQRAFYRWKEMTRSDKSGGSSGLMSKIQSTVNGSGSLDD